MATRSAKGNTAHRETSRINAKPPRVDRRSSKRRLSPFLRRILRRLCARLNSAIFESGTED
eukprot:11966568-Prorocentrum_lima.AAC.1